MTNTTSEFGSCNEQRAQSITRKQNRADAAVTTATALDRLAEAITGLDCPVNAHRATWASVVGRLHMDADNLRGQSTMLLEQIGVLQEHITGAPAFGPSTVRIEAQPNPQMLVPAGPAEWVASATQIELEKALGAACTLPAAQQDDDWINALTTELDARDEFFRASIFNK